MDDDSASSKLVGVFQGAPMDFGSNFSQYVDYPRSTYLEWGFHPSKEEAAGWNQPPNGTVDESELPMIILLF